MVKQIFTSKNDFVASIVAIGLGILFIYNDSQGPNLQSQGETTEITAHVTNYSFKHIPGYRGTSKQYYIWFDEYPCTFQIKADYLSIFDQLSFIAMVSPGDKLTATFPKEYENKLSKQDEFIFISSLSNSSTDFLRLEDAIKKENDNLLFYVGVLFIIGGVVYFLLKQTRII